MNKRMNKWLTLLGITLSLVAGGVNAQLPDFSDLAEKQSPTVVNITTTQDNRQHTRGRKLPEPEEMFEFFRRMMPQEGQGLLPPKRGQGSGFIISTDGYILTNSHVIDDVDEVVIKLNDKREFRAKVIGTDARSDIALVKINATDLPAVRIGDIDKLRIGEWVLAIGAPFGFDNSVTAGIVSAKGRSLPQENYVPFIQTDVAVNPGNSGGPLFNLRGEVVGVNSQIISRSGGYMGVSFAIPINVAMDVAEQLKARGKVNRGRIGVAIQEMTPDLAESFGLSDPKGALVVDVEPGSPAEKAGLQVSDIILKFNGRTINTSSELPQRIGTTKPGEQATLTLWRKGEKRDLKVQIGETTDVKVAVKAPEIKPSNRAGLVVSALSREQKSMLQIENGVQVDEVTGPAVRASIQPGDIIVAVNNQEVNTPEALTHLINDTTRKSAALLIKRGENSHYVSLRLDK